MSTAVTTVRKTLIHCIICGRREAVYRELRTLTLVLELQSYSFEALTGRACPHQTEERVMASAELYGEVLCM